MFKKCFFGLIILMILAVPAVYAQISDAVNFFAFNYCGTGQTVSWRGSCHTADNPIGGFHDAGDHVKFNLPLAFTITMLAWAKYEYGASVSTPVSRGLSYLKACGSGNVIYQVGDPGADHAYWGPPESQTGTRPSYSTTQASCVLADTAAAHACASVAGLGGDMTFAKACYASAESALSDAGYTAANGFYTSFSGFYDELIWAAIWIYLGTNDAAYLAKAENYFTKLNADYTWTHCWDDKRYGAILKLAQITGNPVYITWIEKYLDYNVKGGGRTYTPGGLPFVDVWGSCRYASAIGFLAKLWSQSVYCNSAKVSTYSAIATNVANYIKGSNPRNLSYIIGYGSNWPRCPHHRAADPYKDCSSEALGHRLTGGLIGGPDASDNFTDDVNQYQFTEVAIDYNACLVALLASISGATPPQYPTPSPSPEPDPTALPGTGDGLNGAYYTGTSFGSLVLTRIDPQINFSWGGGSPDTAIPNDGFSVRWTGQIEAVYTDTYVFYDNSDDGCRIYVNNQLISDQWADHAAEELVSSPISLVAGTKYPIQVDFYENAGDASIVISWSGNYHIKEVIPQSRLYSGSSAVTLAPTTPPVITPDPTEPPIDTAAPTETPGPTAIPTATPAGITPDPTVPPGTDTPAPTTDPTSPPATGCTCPNLCSSQTGISVPFTKDGAGEFCWTSSSLGSYVNSWNCNSVNINGTNCTNLYVSSPGIASIGGVYYIYYNGSYAWSHIEIR